MRMWGMLGRGDAGCAGSCSRGLRSIGHWSGVYEMKPGMMGGMSRTTFVRAVIAR